LEGLKVCDQFDNYVSFWPGSPFGMFSFAGKPGASRGGQTVVVSDVSRCRPQAYVHRHKLHPRPAPFTQEGPNEVRMIAEKIEKLLKTETNTTGIFHKRPHMTWDNYFSGDVIMDWFGGQGFAATMTCQRD
jgi:hypothetical protein